MGDFCQMGSRVWRFMCFSGLAILWILTVIDPQFSQAFIPNNMGDDTIELTSELDRGFVVRSSTIVEVQKNKVSLKAKYVFFCLKQLAGGLGERCFFGQAREFKNIRDGLKIQSLQYGLVGRIFNDKTQIPIGERRYFYPVKIISPYAL